MITKLGGLREIRYASGLSHPIVNVGRRSLAILLLASISACVDEPTMPGNVDGARALDEEDAHVQAASTTNWFYNSGDARIAKILAPDGSVATFLGLKDATGTPIRVSSVVASVGGRSSTISFDSLGRVSSVQVPTMGLLTFEYLSTSEVLITGSSTTFGTRAILDTLPMPLVASATRATHVETSTVSFGTVKTTCGGRPFWPSSVTGRLTNVATGGSVNSVPVRTSAVGEWRYSVPVTPGVVPPPGWQQTASSGIDLVCNNAVAIGGALAGAALCGAIPATCGLVVHAGKAIAAICFTAGALDLGGKMVDWFVPGNLDVSMTAHSGSTSIMA